MAMTSTDVELIQVQHFSIFLRRWSTLDYLPRRSNMHCLRRASSRLLSSSRISLPKNTTTTRAKLLLSSSRIPGPFSAQLRWNSSKVAPPVHALRQEVPESEAMSEERKAEAEAKAEAQANAQAQATPGAAPGKREMRMHTLDARMQEKVEHYGPRESGTVYVGNLFYDVEAEDLRAKMETFGTVVRALIVHDNRGMSKGFGYVQFSSIDEARTAIEKMHLQVYEGRQVVVQFSHSELRQSRGSNLNPPSNTLFIGNIPYEFTDRDVQSLFVDIQNLIDVRFAVDRRSGAPRGFCHVEFVGIDAAMKAREQLLLKQPYGRKLRIDYAARKRVSFMAGENVKMQERREQDEWQQQQQEEAVTPEEPGSK